MKRNSLGFIEVTDREEGNKRLLNIASIKEILEDSTAVIIGDFIGEMIICKESYKTILLMIRDSKVRGYSLTTAYKRSQ